MSNTSSAQHSLTPAQLEPPRSRAKRRKGINALPDSEAAKYSPQEILNAAQETWRSDIYIHYRPEVDVIIDQEGKVVKIVFKFYCKYNEPNHHVIMRDRLRTGDGTHNLHVTAQACDVRCGALGVTSHTPNASILGSDIEYSEPLHIALLAIECARDHRSSSSVTSDLRRAEAQLLRPGTHLPTAATVSNYAALLVFDKYIGNMNESDFYTIAVVMCPDRKLKWFAESHYSVDYIRAQVIARFAELFPDADNVQQTSNQTRTDGRNIYTQRHASSSTTQVRPDIDSIHSYLETPVVPLDILWQYGGIIPYWNAQFASRPRLARMALDYLTAPASSVDAERAFSSGRLMINHLQHQVSSQTFQSQMAIGSWFGTPLLPNLHTVASIVQTRM
ncbi:hypothetical protein RSOLAG22IIIB_01988 [Rhizoctonia solani]|uniref:HAT C-terminal dimerisation domain-containing protein n=1 Tax=Rhizoctonia solani TaxID=456999 RepID=A0A0K6GCA0_9AGAM|nr:hypothetical protein RSOLAG22IIIB_01988 [Rhizoctonia solani]